MISIKVAGLRDSVQRLVAMELESEDAFWFGVSMWLDAVHKRAMEIHRAQSPHSRGRIESSMETTQGPPEATLSYGGAEAPHATIREYFSGTVVSHKPPNKLIFESSTIGGFFSLSQAVHKVHPFLTPAMEELLPEFGEYYWAAMKEMGLVT